MDEYEALLVLQFCDLFKRTCENFFVVLNYILKNEDVVFLYTFVFKEA